MTKHRNFIVAVALAALISPAALLVPALATAQANPDGAALYQAKCGGCHSLAVNRVGPAHKGVFGRKAGAAPGYRYSPALKASPIVWNDATLDLWLQNPQKLVRGTKMFLSVPEADQRKAIIAYLKAPTAR